MTLHAVSNTQPTTPPVQSRTPEPAPHLAAEVAVLGALMLSDRARTEVPTLLDPDDFDRPAHRTLYSTILDLIDRGEVPDPIVVNAALADTGKLDEVGGLAAVWDCTSIDGCFTPSAFPAYCRIVKDAADRRRQVSGHLEALRRLGVDVQEVTA